MGKERIGEERSKNFINRRRKKKSYRRKRIIRNRIFFALGIISIIVVIIFVVSRNIEKENNDNHIKVKVSDNSMNNNSSDVKDNKEKEKSTEVITITAAGDCTLGTDTNFGYSGSFQAAVEEYNYDYSTFMKNVFNIFNEDDYTIVNLESTFTDSTIKADKGEGRVFHFKGPKDYVKILTTSSIEGVTLSNNHTYDYGQIGLEDTMNVLDENNIDYCGNGYKIIKDVRGIKIGFLGYSAWWFSNEFKDQLKGDIKELRNEGCNIVIPYFHWGEEGKYTPSETQESIGRYAIDSGADMVLGSHPHVMQGLESYNGKLIVYSLGNFCFGGNFNPSDKQTLIIQAKFELEENCVKNIKYKIIPTTVSSVDYKNDYIPTIATESERNEIITKMNELSPTLNNVINYEYFSTN